MSFGEKLTKLRKEKGMSQEDLASNLNVSRQAVSKWESNNSYPETEKIVAICSIFKCSMDELIGLKDSQTKKENKIIANFNKYLDQFIKAIRLFYCMTFKQKIKCIFEMMIYGVLLFIIFSIFDVIIIEIIRKLLFLLPNEILVTLIQTFKGILLLIYLITGIYVLVKLYKIRYLNYYEEFNKKEKIKENIVVEHQESKININEEKIIIRDPISAFKPFNWIKKSLIYFSKFLAIFIVFALSITFVVLIASMMFVLYFVNNGILILYMALGMFGAIISIYVMLEILVKFIFNMKQSPKRLFIMFIFSMLIVGISGGFFSCELTTYKMAYSKTYDKLIYNEELKMEDELIINFLYYENVEIIYENRENILVEYYGTDRNISFIKTLKKHIICENARGEEITYYKRYMYYNNYDYLNDETINEFIRSILIGIKNKEIVSENVLFNIVPRVYISKENYDKLKRHFDEYQSNRDLYWCKYE